MTMLKNVQTLGELCLGAARRYKSRKALELCRGDRLLETVNYRTLALRSLQLAGLFRSLGLRRGDRIMILAENCPQWLMAALGAALGGMVFLPVDPRSDLRSYSPSPAGNSLVEGPPVESPPAGSRFRDLGERAGIKALCVTGGTGELAAGPEVPRIYLDTLLAGREPADQGGILVSLGGVLKRLPLEDSPRPGPGGFAGTGRVEREEPALIWPDGTESSHGELLSLAAGRGAPPGPRFFPRDRIVPLSSLAERGTLIRGCLAAILGGASLSCVAGAGETAETADTAELRRTLELLRPSVLIGPGAFLEALYRGGAASLAEGPLGRNSLTRPLARYLGGRALIRALGGNVRFFGLTGGPDLDPELEGALSRVHLPRAALEAPGKFR